MEKSPNDPLPANHGVSSQKNIIPPGLSTSTSLEATSSLASSVCSSLEGATVNLLNQQKWGSYSTALHSPTSSVAFCRLNNSEIGQSRCTRFGEFCYCWGLSLLPSLPAAFTQPCTLTLTETDFCTFNLLSRQRSATAKPIFWFKKILLVCSDIANWVLEKFYFSAQVQKWAKWLFGSNFSEIRSIFVLRSERDEERRRKGRRRHNRKIILEERRVHP